MTARPPDPESRRMPLGIAVALALVMVAVLLAAGCVSQSETNNPAETLVKTIKVTLQLPTSFPITPISTPIVRTRMSNSVEGKYVFLEHRVNWSTEKISGGCPAGQSYYCPKSYDMNNSVLIVDSDTYGNAPVNESMVLFYGVQNRVGGTDGFDCGNNGWFSYSLPGQFSENITIDSVSEEGTVAFHFMDFSGKLKPFERWENISRYRYHYDKTCVDGECLPECTKDIVKSHGFFNGGFLDKKSILLLQTTG